MARMNIRVALYARYSSDLQSTRSIADQLALLRQDIARRGWQEAAVYTDEAISAASMVTRPGLQALLADSAAGRFDAVMAEALDRLSRDQADTAIIHRALQFHEVRLVTLSEQDVTPLHVGFKGLMNSMFLTELAAKTRRGLRGRIEAGTSAGGLAYGYRLGRETGLLDVDPEQADIVREIHTRYASGASARTLAADLNRRGIPGPRGAVWQATTISGQRANGNGILNNELYVGRRIWNRRRKVTNPATGKKRNRPNPEADWITEDVPSLRILTDDQWAATKAMQDRMGGKMGGQRRRPTRPLSGLLTCGCCGGPMNITTQNRYGCAHRRQRGTCSEARTIAAGEVEGRIFAALDALLRKPDLLESAGSDWARHQKETAAARNRARIEAEKDLVKLRRQIERTLDLLLETDQPPAPLMARLREMEAKQAELQARLAEAAPAAVIAMPQTGQRYADLIAELAEAAADPVNGHEVREAIAAVVHRITIRWPEEGEKAEIFVEGDLGAILQNAENPQCRSTAGSLVVGAGVGFEPTTFRL